LKTPAVAGQPGFAQRGFRLLRRILTTVSEGPLRPGSRQSDENRRRHGNDLVLWQSVIASSCNCRAPPGVVGGE
jgi:hypothetical protein